MKYRKKPVVIDTIQWTGNNKLEILDFIGGHGCYRSGGVPEGIFIFTLEGEHFANVGDWIIKGIKGEFYPCKPDIFEKTYEPVRDY
jgi:hypothetical protein